MPRYSQNGKGKPFVEKLVQAVERNDSLLCVGLDPDPSRLPDAVRSAPDPIFEFNRHIIDLTADLVCAYKPNFAFYEAMGPSGLEALRRTIDYVPAHIPVILDAKWGDIGSTAEAYARAAFERWEADAVTVNPYLGTDAVEPFLRPHDRGVFVLCHTSNPGARDLQRLLAGGRPVYQIVVDLAKQWNVGGNVGLVVGATFPEELRVVRRLAPDMWLLVPGVGAQGGDVASAIAAGADAQGRGIIISVTRSVIYAADIRAAAQSLVEQIRAAVRQTLSSAHDPQAIKANHPERAQRSFTAPGASEVLDVEQLALALYDAGCIQFGSFILQSGRASPIYIDLRLLASYPSLLQQVAQAYAWQLRHLTFDRLAAIPYAALPIGTAVALATGQPLIYPRKSVKAHGTGRAIEGDYHPGQIVVILDDLITTGASKLEAIAPLKAAGLVVRDIVVLIDREQGGKEELEAQGYRVHSIMGLRALLDVLVEAGRITAEQRAEVVSFLW